MAILSLISITVPGIARSVNKIVLGFVYMDLLKTDLWLDNYITFDHVNDYAINLYFEDSGFGSINSIINLGSTFVYIIIAALCYVFLLITNALSKCSER